MSDKIEVRVTSAFVQDDGTVARPNEKVFVTKSLAASLLRRGKAELVDAADAPEQAEVLSTQTVTGEAPAPKKGKRKGKAAEADGESDEDGEDA